MTAVRRFFVTTADVFKMPFLNIGVFSSHAVMLVLLGVVFSLAQGGWISAVIMASALVGVMDIWALTYRRQLDDRIAAGNGRLWRIRRDGVEIASINDARYAALQRRVMISSHTHLAQIANAGRAARRMGLYYLRIAPTVALAMVVMGCMACFIAPKTVATIALSGGDDPAGVAFFVGKILALYGATVMGLSAILAGLFGQAMFGLVNCFHDAAMASLRADLGLDSGAPITLSDS